MKQIDWRIKQLWEKIRKRTHSIQPYIQKQKKVYLATFRKVVHFFSKNQKKIQIIICFVEMKQNRKTMTHRVPCCLLLSIILLHLENCCCSLLLLHSNNVFFSSPFAGCSFRLNWFSAAFALICWKSLILQSEKDWLHRTPNTEHIGKMAIVKWLKHANCSKTEGEGNRIEI